ncbi:MAG: PAS domain-containing protein [Brevundimonas sp.]|uniref:PAS domain-containing sensor histidine kinase n=1 Tax=Brevundimonas sp. TaxID=1871086 RepID=UPI0025C466D9|nr:ATP-binding protein [Brevundimonas sp.]MBX3477460.1 PAS domain-containing protein [Brevundimonas sp.]
MLLEGEINWMLVLAVTAGVTTLIAVIAAVFAVSRGVRHASTSGELDLVQKVAEAADRRLFETLNAIPVALVETDRAGKFVFANRAAHQLLGRRDAELLGLRFHSATWGITYPDGRPVPPDLLPSARALRGQTVKGFQHLLANPATRRKMLVSVTAMPIENELGEITGSTAAIVETETLAVPEAVIEPVMAAEAASPAEADLTRRVFEAAPGALVVVGADGRVREANGVAQALAGDTPAADADFADLFLDETDREAARLTLQSALTGAEAAPIMSRQVAWSVLRLPGVDGAEDALLLAGEAAGAPVAEAEVEAVVAEAPDQAAIDTREAELAAQRDAALAQAEAARAEAESARRAAQETQAQAEADLAGGRRMENVGRLTGGLAHDFNALLGVMTSALDMMLRQADDPARVRRLGQAALAAGQRGETLTRRLTAFAQGDDEAPALQVLDAGVMLKAMESRLRALAGPGVDLMVEAPSEPAPVRMDPVAFEGAVRALTANAIEAVGGAGSVAVRLESLLEGGLRLSVRDSGPGMDRELAARALEPFFTTKPGAAGLGLPQAYAFARQSGGRLSIDSGPGEGAEVAVTLPLARAEDRAA